MFPRGTKPIAVAAALCAAIVLATRDGTAADDTDIGKPSFDRDMAASMKLMDHGMSAAPMDGNVDHDFAAMMLPHHQGAVDMAKAELSYGRDPAMRRLAEEIIVDQKSEIDLMNLWLRTHAETGKELCR